ncbi:MAG TPA: hypothetical protein VFN42_01155 [Acetobacteraceae bacterium]|nr:hypothetical protein [Acetobacteraceae bacterium]
MKKGETPEFTVKWWKGSQPKGLKSAGGLESALKDYETAKGKLESSGEDTDADAASKAMDDIIRAVKAVITEASKTKSDEMTATTDCLKKFDRLYAAERKWIEEHTEASDDNAFGDPEVYHVYLLTMLKRLRSSGEMNFGFVLGKKPEDHRLALHKSKSSKGLANILVKQTGIHQMTWGIARPDEERGGLLVLTLEGRVLPGMAKKAGRMLKKFKPLPFKKLALVVDGKEELEDLEAADVADDDDDDLEMPAGTQQDGRDATALTRELAELAKRIQGVSDAGLKGDLARMATQANALLRSNNLPEAGQRIDELRAALDQAPGNTQPGNGASGGASTVAYAKSRLAWLAARKKVEGEIDKLRSEIVATYKDDGIADQLESSFRTRVAPVLETLDESLADKLDEVANTTDATARAELVTEAKAIMQRYQSYLSSETLIADLDDNPFSPLTIQQTISATLSALEKAVH